MAEVRGWVEGAEQLVRCTRGSGRCRCRWCSSSSGGGAGSNGGSSSSLGRPAQPIGSSCPCLGPSPGTSQHPAPGAQHPGHAPVMAPGRSPRRYASVRTSSCARWAAQNWLTARPPWPSNTENRLVLEPGSRSRAAMCASSCGATAASGQQSGGGGASAHGSQQQRRRRRAAPGAAAAVGRGPGRAALLGAAAGDQAGRRVPARQRVGSCHHAPWTRASPASPPGRTPGGRHGPPPTPAEEAEHASRSRGHQLEVHGHGTRRAPAAPRQRRACLARLQQRPANGRMLLQAVQAARSCCAPGAAPIGAEAAHLLGAWGRQVLPHAPSSAAQGLERQQRRSVACRGSGEKSYVRG